MNIFCTSECPERSARWCVDRHVSKMPLETAQLLCAAYHVQGIHAPYRLTHKNHPSTVWSRTSCLNYEWTIKHGKMLCDEYTARYGRRHASQDVIEWCDNNSHNLKFDNFEQTEFAVAIGSDMLCRQVTGFDQMPVVDKYRFYYRLDKAHLHHWKRNKPNWI